MHLNPKSILQRHKNKKMFQEEITEKNNLSKLHDSRT